MAEISSGFCKYIFNTVESLEGHCTENHEVQNKQRVRKG